MVKPAAILFDLYNTLIPFTIADYVAVVEHMAAVVDMPPTVFMRHWQNSWVQHEEGVYPTVGDHISHVCTTLDHVVRSSQVRQAEATHYRYQQQLLTPAADMLALLDQLRQRGYQLGVISNCPLETPLLWPTSPLAPLFDTAIFSCVEGVRKPDARIFRCAYERLERRADECVMVGDSWPADVLGARQAGLAAVWLNPAGKASPDPTVVPAITALSDLIDLLDTL